MDLASELKEVKLVIDAVDQRMQIVASEDAHPYVVAYQMLVLLDQRVTALIAAERAVAGSEHARMFDGAIQQTMTRLLEAKERVDYFDMLLAERLEATLH